MYANSNVDILHDNGKVFNIPDIKNAILTTAKGINDVKFYGDRIYLATDFGIVVLNDKKNEVSESYNYGKNQSDRGELCDKYCFCCRRRSLLYKSRCHQVRYRQVGFIGRCTGNDYLCAYAFQR